MDMGLRAESTDRADSGFMPFDAIALEGALFVGRGRWDRA